MIVIMVVVTSSFYMVLPSMIFIFCLHCLLDQHIPAKFIQNTVVINEDTTEEVPIPWAQIEQLKRELHRTQCIQRSSLYSFTTPSDRSDKQQDLAESSCIDPIDSLEPPYIFNGGLLSSFRVSTGFW